MGQHEVKKLSKIVDELITFFFLKKTNKMNIEIEDLKDHYEITMVNDCCELTSEKLEILKSLFNVQRQREVEEYYWRLAGETDDESELSLVGTMIDDATVEYKDNKIIVKLIRYK